MAVQWTNNFNDDLQSDTVITAIVDGNQASGTALKVDNLTLTDHDGGANWRAGDEFTLKNSNDDDHAAVLYSITALSAMGMAGVNKEYTLTISPTLAAQADNNGVITKEDSYKGNHGSAENHLRLRNMGLI
jgi:hypothetical protein